LQTSRELQIIGEAVRNLPESLTRTHSEIPWRKIAGMRDKLIHEYFGVDLPMTWEVVERDIPKFKAEILFLQQEIMREAM
jgi:uncharacterized protein with HEPN domain